MMAGKVALVLGASRGIGAAAARAFAKAGAKVALAARSPGPLEELARELRESGAEALAIPADAADAASLRALVEQVLGAFGRLDAAFNNAGATHLPAPLADLSVEDIETTISANLRATLLAMKFEIPALLASGGGAIVNMSSAVSGAARMGAYAAAKRGLVAATRAAAVDYAGRNLRINAVSPGPILTDRLRGLPEEQRAQAARAVPMGRIGAPEEVAAAVIWLCSEQASYVTGADLPIDGGRMAMGCS